MLVRLLTQLVIVTTLAQVVPTDAAGLQQQATLPEPPVRSFDVLETYELLSHLPQAQDISDLAPTKINPNSLGVVTSAQSAIVIDRASGHVLFEKNSNTSRSIGSITKLMTAEVFLRTNPDLNAPATIKSEDIRLGALIRLPVGETVTNRQLLEASLIGSDNSATAALARLSGYSLDDFIARMNEVAAEIGMNRTTFADTTGLSSHNRSVVTDIATLLDHVENNEVIRDITRLPSVVITGESGRQYFIESTDQLLNTFVNQPPYTIEVAKTGFLPEAGYCLGTMFSHQNGGEIMVVVLGSESKLGRFDDVKALAVWAYQNFQWNL